MNKYSTRLLNEWKQHGKLVLSCDYDSTLCHYRTIDNVEDIIRAIDLVRKAQETGIYLVIFTASDEGRYDEILEYCTQLGLKVDSINKNPINLKYGNNGKIFYNINLCDRSGLTQALDILEETMNAYKLHLNDTKRDSIRVKEVS